MIKLEEKALFTLLLFAFVALLSSLTLGLGRVARLVPIVVVIPTLLLLVIQLMIDLLPQLAKKYSIIERQDVFRVEPLREKSLSGLSDERQEEDVSRRNRELKALLWLLVMFGLIYLLGFLIALPLYVFLYLKQQSGEGWMISITTAAGIFALLYGVFVFAIGTGLYEGHLWRWIGG
jgi:hypothetical protein